MKSNNLFRFKRVQSSDINFLSYEIGLKQILVFIPAILLSFVFPLIGLVVSVLILVGIIGQLRRFTLVESVVLAFTGIFATNIVLYSFLTVFHLHLPVTFSPAVTSLILLLLVFFYYKQLTYPSWKDFNQSDFIAVAVSLVCLCLLLIPIITHRSADEVAWFMSYGEDNASHYALSRYDFINGSFAYNQSPEEAGVVKSLEIYPQGFHINAAVFVGLIKPFTISEVRFLQLYALFVALIYSSFVFWLIKLVASSLSKLNKIIAISIVPGLALLGGLSFFILLVDRGFQPQIFAFLFLCALIYVVIRSDGQKYNNSIVLLLLLLSVGIAASWWFLLFVAFFVVMFYFAKNGLFKTILDRWRDGFLIKLSLLFGIIYPILVNVVLSKKNDPISEPGGVDVLPVNIFIVLAVIIISLSLLKIVQIRKLSYLYTALLASVTLTVLIGTYHLIRLGHFEYYFYKTTYAVLLFLIIICSAIVIEIGQWLYLKLTKKIRWVIPSTFVIGMLVIGIGTNFLFINVYVNRWLPSAVELNDLDVLFDKNSSKYKDVIFVGDCNTSSDYLSNRWSGARYLSENSQRKDIEKSTFDGDWKSISSSLAKYTSHSQHILIVIDSRCANKLSGLTGVETNNENSYIFTH